MNLLNQAHKLIPHETIQYSSWTGSTQDSQLLEVNIFADAITTKVKINAIETSNYARLGLDYKKNYVYLFSVPSVSGLSRINNGDQFVFNNTTYQVESQTGWFPSAGWDSFVCVEIST